MPSINLRLTDAGLKRLRAWASDARRSVQKEIIWRLFDVEAVGAPKVGPATKEERVTIEVPVGETGELPAKPRPRLHPCKHHVPPTRVCQYCDVGV